MDTSNVINIASTLCYWTTFLSQSLPVRSIGTWFELLVGCMLSERGFVTEAMLSIQTQRHWSSYYKLLEYGRWSWLALARRVVEWLYQVIKPEDVWFVLDDTLTYRASRQAPKAGWHHQHGQKANRPVYGFGQNWLSLAAVVSYQQKLCAIPLVSWLITPGGNTSKLRAGCVLLRALRRYLTQGYLLLDSWFMKGKLVQYALAQGLQVIGQVRHDTRLYARPEASAKRGRGRPRRYGRRYTKAVRESLPVQEAALEIYGKRQLVRYQEVEALARFLKGRAVKAIWCWFVAEGKETKPRLLLCTDTNLSAEQIIIYYAKRWLVEPMFCDLKQRFGFKDCWQQSARLWQRWIAICSVGYAFTRLLALTAEANLVEAVTMLMPWRKENVLTAGQVQKVLQRIFEQVEVRRWWDKKCRIFKPPSVGKPPTTRPAWQKAA
jgi:hypothetical protein